ncbi:MAG: hypothetical protein PHW52_03675 [Candidatus Pacebacteria bacterium]|nr:hypothetical protein [Candidatus Paceibacterota bacterium]
MNFENNYFEDNENEEAADLETEGNGNNIYKIAREDAEFLLDKFEYFDEGDVMEISPEVITEDVPVFVSPGWGVSPEAQIEGLETIAEEGERKVITANFSRKELIEGYDDENIPTAELQKALAIIDIIDSKGLEFVDGIGHSEGGLNLAIAASLFPEKFRNLVFISPAGSINISYAELVKRFAVDEGIEEFKGMDKEKLFTFYNYLKSVVKNFLKNPILSNKEISEMTELDIFEMSKEIKGNGIGVSFIAGANDKVFPMDEINKNVDEGNVDYYLSTKGNHGAFIFDQRYAQLAENLLDNMKEKNNKEN